MWCSASRCFAAARSPASARSATSSRARSRPTVPPNTTRPTPSCSLSERLSDFRARGAIVAPAGLRGRRDSQGVPRPRRSHLPATVAAASGRRQGCGG
ncbi:MAG: hypothetical protein FJ309_09545 [Planctomycetes bacterium]|nr:hypothetical protein [Planctomycetota bacterium]